jgi:hypothetical protein
MESHQLPVENQQLAVENQELPVENQQLAVENHQLLVESLQLPVTNISFLFILLRPAPLPFKAGTSAGQLCTSCYRCGFITHTCTFV